MPVEESQRAAWFSEFDKLGESLVRMEVDSSLQSDSGHSIPRVSCAREWLRLKDEERAASNAWWARHAAIAAYVAAIIATISMIKDIFWSKH